MKRKADVMPNHERYEKKVIFFSLKIMRRAEEGNLGEKHSFGKSASPITWQKNSLTFLKHLLCTRVDKGSGVEL